MNLPNEIIDKIFMYSSSKDIHNWKDLKCMRELTYLRKKDGNLFDAIISENYVGVEYLLQSGHIAYPEAIRWAILLNNTKILRLLLDHGGGNTLSSVLFELLLLMEMIC